jgi:polysaccharide pyruvyl transferase WcaK-like protein
MLGMYASRNLGDTSIQTAVMRALRSRRRDIEFVGLCQDPVDTVSTFGILAIALPEEGAVIAPETEGQAPVTEPSSPRRRMPWVVRRIAAIWRFYRAMRNLDMLLVLGGRQVDDYCGGPRAQPFRLFACSPVRLVTYRAYAAQVRGHFAVGVDQLRTRLVTLLSVGALELAHMGLLSGDFREPGRLSY